MDPSFKLIGLAIMLLIYFGLHFGLYSIFFRHKEWFCSEKGVFAYHFIPACVVIFASVWGLMLGYITPSAVGICVSAQGVYSISFLELWSLTQGGYSIAILLEIQRAEIEGNSVDGEILSSIGAGKQTGRLQNLSDLGLVSSVDGKIFQLTTIGRLVSFVPGFFAFVAGTRLRE